MALYQPSLRRESHPPTRLLPRRKLDRLAWALLAVALGWIAQDLFSREELWPGLLLYAAAIPLFAAQLATPRPEAPDQAGAALEPFHWPGASDVRGSLGVAAILNAVLLSCLSWYLFGLEGRSLYAWVIYFASLALFGLGVWLASPPSPRGSKGGSAQRPLSRSLISWSPDPWLLAILSLALFMRLFLFSSLPFGTWYDEATAGLEARRILQDAAFRPVFSVAMNQVAHHLYLFALSMELLGDNIGALRAVSVLFGLGTVVAAYLFGRELGGRRWGLLLAFLVASMRWHVNFSRIAMNGVDATFFEFLALYLALRAARGWPGQVRAIAALGLAVGLGLCFYSAFRLFVIAGGLVGLIILIKAHRSPYVPRPTPQVSPQETYPQGGPTGGLPLTLDASRFTLHASGFTLDAPGLVSRQSPAPALGVLLLAIWLAAMPMTQYAWRHSQEFWGRAQHVSILQNRDDPNLARALAQNLQKHLLMFNYKGDNNGRHNLPGAPTLDRLSAVLFALGLGLALARHDRFNLFFLCLLLAGLLGGILTLDFEAPQSLRSIGALPAVVYFIALSLDALWSELRRAAGITRPRYSLAPVVLGLGAIAFGNAYTYFGPQAHDPSVWLEFSTAETLVGKRMAQLGPGPVYYLSPFFFDHVSIRFHAPAQSPLSLRKLMPLPDPLPARELPERPVVYFIHPDEEWVFALAHQIYPAAHFETLPAEPQYPPAVFVVYLEPEDVASVQGLEVSYWANDVWDGPPQASARSPGIDAAWPADSPLELPFVAEWAGVLYAPWYGPYTLKAVAPAYLELTLDGQIVQGEGNVSLVQNLAQGNHELRLRAAGGQGQVRLGWQPPQGEGGSVPAWALYTPPVNANGLLGKYYANPDWQGAPALERIDPTLNQYFHLTPLPRPYSVEWTGTLDVPAAGIDGLGLRAVDQARLYLDGRLVVETSAPDAYTEEKLALSPGPHTLRITFQDLTGRSRIHLYWTPPGRDPEIIPTAYLHPPFTRP